MKVSQGIFTVPNKSFELRRCSNYRKSNYRESTVFSNKGKGQITQLKVVRKTKGLTKTVFVSKTLQP